MSLAGRSESDVEAVKVSAVSSSTLLLPMAARTGAALTSLTVMAIVSVSVSAPSLTTTVTGYVPGPCASVGVQVKWPPDVMDAPAGAPDR
jgi:hypothetical protein